MGFFESLGSAIVGTILALVVFVIFIWIAMGISKLFMKTGEKVMDSESIPNGVKTFLFWVVVIGIILLLVATCNPGGSAMRWE